jgi:hypothetical protein
VVMSRLIDGCIITCNVGIGMLSIIREKVGWGGISTQE